MNSSTITLAALQVAPEHARPEANIEQIERLIGSTSFDLLVIPELASTGYFFTDRNELLPLAESPEDGAFCTWMRRLAAERGGVVVGGFAERGEGDRLYNSALVALPDGGWHVYRKAHLFYKEKLVFEPGDSGFFVVDCGRFRLGTMICYDWRFPEAARTLALLGADVIAHPSNLVAAKALWAPTMETRSFENKVVTVTANRFGVEEIGGERLEFTGESQIVAMNGRPLAIAPPSGECVITAEVDPVATRGKGINQYNDIIGDRRPELYGVG